MELVLSRYVERIEKEGRELGIGSRVIRELLAEFWEIHSRDPDSFAELVEETLC